MDIDNRIITDHNICVGCEACASICPVNCIKMIHDEEGFYYPQVDRLSCIKCNACISVCPANNKPTMQTSPKCYAAHVLDEGLRLESSSGGIFAALALNILEKDGFVCGAAFDDDYKVRHLIIEDSEELWRLQKSKYVQSRICDLYKIIKKKLEENKLVLFCGTPCQVNGLHNYLNREYDTLLAVDIVCHGVPSEKTWLHYLKGFSNDTNDILSVNFRSKDTGWKSFGTKITFKNGKEYYSIHDNDDYMKAFLNNVSLRPSCYKCVAKYPNKASDITLGDFWGLYRTGVNDDDKGTSLVLVNTNKGKLALNNINDRIEMVHTNLSESLCANRNAYASVDLNPNRKRFFNNIYKESFHQAVELSSSIPIPYRIINKLKRIFLKSEFERSLKEKNVST